MDRGSDLEKLRVAVASAAASVGKALERPPQSRDLREIAIIGLSQAVCDHSSAILSLSRESSQRSSNVLLRTLLESLISLRYIEDDPTTDRAAAYAAKEVRRGNDLLRNLLRMIRETPAETASVVAASGMQSFERLVEFSAKMQAEVDKFSAKGVPQFPTIADCAKATGLELLYRTVYGHLLSQQVHASAGDTLRGVVTGGPEQADPSKILLTTLHVLVDVLGVLSRSIQQPSQQEVRDFVSLLNEMTRLVTI